MQQATGVVKLEDIFSQIKSYISLLPDFTYTNFLEVLIIAVIVYELLQWIMDSKAWTLLKGIGVILVFTLFSYIFHLSTILWLLEKGSTIGVIVLVVIFQPELRRALEQLGRQKFLLKIGFAGAKQSDDKSMYKETASQIVKAVFAMGKVKTGALIVIEQEESLKDFVRTGIVINGVVSSGLLINIFEKNTPLHDGAVIIRGNTILAATCYLPLSENMDISKDLGTRHRAALGMSEVNDSITIIVSEETGTVNVAYKGKLQKVPDENGLEKILINRINKREMSLFGVIQKGSRAGK